MRSLRASISTPALPHALGWLFFFLLTLISSPGKTVADTKHDLTANPAGFLRGAMSAWTDLFPLGQLQNQAYGYLFPHGLFFLITEPLPDWFAQRLWWTVVLGVGFSGFLVLGRRLALRLTWALCIGAVLWALSPHTLSTLGAISSETWPMMLTPWVLAPLIARPRAQGVAPSLLAVAAMGAVNAVATGAAALPAAIYLGYQRRWRALGTWLLGCAAVSAWWIGPLLVLGHYSPPFTNFIESSYVTTRWLNLTEILRGTTHWAPFAEAERVAGTVLATNPYFVLLTCCVAALGLIGLTRFPRRGPWVVLLCVGVGFLGAAHGPFGPQFLTLLDGPLAPIRNVHKFDALVRLPLTIGLVHVVSQLATWRPSHARDHRPRAAFALVITVLVCSISPAWSGRLAPRGAFDEVPAYWHEAADWLNTNAGDTRTMVLPASSFARQTWGWTRDEPLQPLLDVPWVVRDAVPLVNPEAIRGLDGLVAMPSVEGFTRLGVGALVVRHDLNPDLNSRLLAEKLRANGLEPVSFGEVDIFPLDLHNQYSISDSQPVRVAGGGESLALVDAQTGPHLYELTDPAQAEIITDTPMLATRNYGSIYRAESAPLATLAEGADVHNRVLNYPTTVQPLAISERGGAAIASSTAAAATAFGGASPDRAVTAAVDDNPDTAWYPAPGRQEGEWVELQLEHPVDDPTITVITEGSPVVVTADADGAELNRATHPHQVVTFTLPKKQVRTIRLTFGASEGRAGLAEFAVEGRPLTRILALPATPEARMFFFQRAFIDTGLIRREFQLTKPMRLRLDAATCHEDPATAAPADTDMLIDGAPVGCDDVVALEPGTHTISSTSRWLQLTDVSYSLPAAPVVTGADLTAADHVRILNTHRAANPGLRAYLGEVTLKPVTVDAGAQGFVIPAGASGSIRLEFAGDRPYRWSLGLGALLAMITVLGCAMVARRRHCAETEALPEPPTAWMHFAIALCAGGLTVGWPILLVAPITWAIARYTLIRGEWLAGSGLAVAGLWLAHAPWPANNYSGDQWFTAIAATVSLVALALPKSHFRTQRATGRSTNS